MDLFRSMLAFQAVAVHSGFTGAAHALNVSNATVTGLVQQLEGHWGVTLFHRTTRRVTLTNDGAAALERVERLLQDVTDLGEGMRGATRAATGRLRVDVPAAFGRHILAPALPRFFAKFPGIQLEVGSSDRPVDLLRESVDCVVRGGPVVDETLVARRLKNLPMITCAAPAYIKKHGAPQTPDECTHHKAVAFLSPLTGKVATFDFERNGVAREVTVSHLAACNDTDTLIACGVAGLGLFQTPRSAYVNSLLRSKKLVRVLSDWDVGQLPIFVLYPPTRHLNARVRAFVDWLVESKL
ncbi:MAG: LysR family transcriptional regulator [Polyangiaceae bacterium]|nr:LysR family transcriptional regulator [Polyangiaceae bacterium]